MRQLTCALLVAIAGCRSSDRANVQQAGDASPDTLVIDGTRPSCAECTLEVGDPVRLGKTDDREIPRRVPEMLRDSRGTIYLTFHGWGDKPILRYDSTGRLLGAIGRRGSGPGEYNLSMGAFIGPGDSLFVEASGMALIAYGPDGSFGRNERMIGFRPIAISRDGSLLATRARQGYGWDTAFVYRLGPHATPRDSFALFTAPSGVMVTRSSGKARITSEHLINGVPVFAPDGSVWTVHESYRLEHHDTTGVPYQLFGVKLPDRPAPIMTLQHAESIAALIRGGDKEIRKERRASFFERGPRRRTDVMVAADGLLWVVRAVPAPSWDTIKYKSDKLSPDEAPEEETIPRDIEDRLYHTIVEIIDPKRAQLIARVELPFLGIAAAPGYIGRVTADDDGFYVPSIYPLRLRR